MRLVAISRVRNEADVIEAFVRHTATVVDHHLILDNASTDATRDILDALVAEGLPIDVADDPVPGMGAAQAEAMTRLMRAAAGREGAGWVIPLDADEFIATTDGRTVAEHLGSLEAPAFAHWRTYVPRTAAATGGPLNPVERITHRLVAEAEPWRKVIVPFGLARRGSLEVGNHDVVPAGRDPGRTTLAGVVLAHFPVRSAEQYAVKIAIGNLGILSSGGDRIGLGFHYREPFALLMSDWERFRETFADSALRFAVPPSRHFTPELLHEPFPYAGGPLRHTADLRDSEPWRSILEYAAQLAQRLSVLSEPPDQRRRVRKASRAGRARSQKPPA